MPVTPSTVPGLVSTRSARSAPSRALAHCSHGVRHSGPLPAILHTRPALREGREKTPTPASRFCCCPRVFFSVTLRRLRALDP
eukprot:1306295-Rhodomonas_salina.1